MEAVFIDKILKTDDDFHQKFGINFIRPEAKIMLILKRNGPLSIKETMSFLNLSYRGFYLIIRKMIDQGHIVVEQDKIDGRVKKLNVANC